VAFGWPLCGVAAPATPPPPLELEPLPPPPVVVVLPVVPVVLPVDAEVEPVVVVSGVVVVIVVTVVVDPVVIVLVIVVVAWTLDGVAPASMTAAVRPRAMSAVNAIAHLASRLYGRFTGIPPFKQGRLPRFPGANPVLNSAHGGKAPGT
jgi:hypothetical protein